MSISLGKPPRVSELFASPRFPLLLLLSSPLFPSSVPGLLDFEIPLMSLFIHPGELLRVFTQKMPGPPSDFEPFEALAKDLFAPIREVLVRGMDRWKREREQPMAIRSELTPWLLSLARATQPRSTSVGIWPAKPPR